MLSLSEEEQAEIKAAYITAGSPPNAKFHRCVDFNDGNGPQHFFAETLEVLGKAIEAAIEAAIERITHATDHHI